MTAVYEKLIATLDEGGARYRVIEHAPEGRTELVSELRGHSLDQAAKCIVVRVKVTKKISKYVLAVVPGNRRVDLAAIKNLLDGVYVSFAETETAERLTGSRSGTILPFAVNPELRLVVDPALLAHDEIYFNAGALDKSLALRVEDYVALAEPAVVSITEPG
ncbi:MAG TPA: YbaK/EbsC family protein [Amycolatopsis sp.]|nr:YbaK/EbsC family protein [Amycolatopsis sp.]